MSLGRGTCHTRGVSAGGQAVAVGLAYNTQPLNPPGSLASGLGGAHGGLDWGSILGCACATCQSLHPHRHGARHCTTEVPAFAMVQGVWLISCCGEAASTWGLWISFNHVLSPTAQQHTSVVNTPRPTQPKGQTVRV